MDTQTILLIFLAAIAALGLVVFQYRYKSKTRGSIGILLSLLRFIACFGVFLLLINPEFNRTTYSLVKSNLILLMDNSSSVSDSGEEAIHQSIKEDKELTEKFNIYFHSFGGKLNASDSLTFNEKNTNIAQALKSLQTIYGGANMAVMLVTDGNQTLGEDYEFFGKTLGVPIFPVVVGDTTRYEDLRVGQVNTNKYAFLKNKYPVETYVSYEGNGNVATTLTISVNGKLVHREVVNLSNTANTKVINTLLEATTVGTKKIIISVGQLTDEKNTINNQKEVALEVIDEKTNIVIISDMLHPDIGAIKKSIESNEQRSVSIFKPTINLKNLEGVDLFILYQPNSAFKSIYQFLKQNKANILTITGSKTDWNFLNGIQSSFNKKSYNQLEEMGPRLNAGFTIFNISDFSIADFPPLDGNLGEITMLKPYETLLSQRIKGVDLEQPLMAVFSSDLDREAVLFGENLWKWRMQSYRNDQQFDNFDALIGKLVLYLSTTKAKTRFSVDHETVYQGNVAAKISAIYYDQSFVFDPNASITLTLKNAESKKTMEFPMLLKHGYYETDLTDLEAGRYDYLATVREENLTKTGTFTVLDFNVEQQFLSSDYKKLGRLAENSSGKRYFSNEAPSLINDLMASDRFLPTQISAQNVVSLVDFRFVLGIIAAALAFEWFIRKFNGLI